MKIIHTADWHFDLSNLESTAWAVHRFADRYDLANGPADVVVMAGDVAVHRGAVNPHVAFEIRRAAYRLAKSSRLGALILTGNHDQSFHADRHGAVVGLMGGPDHLGLGLIETPQTIHLRDEDGLDVAFVMVPTPNKYWLHAAGIESDAEGASMVVSVIQGLIAQARGDGAGRVVVSYHGTIAGSMAGDERVMPAGLDFAIPRTAFAGADAVMLGHIHKHQAWPATAALPAMAYSGAVAPLTWNDRKMTPVVYEWTITRDEVSWRTIPLEVRSQMIQLEVEELDPAAVVTRVRSAVVDNVEIPDGARVRVKVRAPASGLALLTSKFEDEIVELRQLRQLKVVPEPTDSGLVRMDLGDGWGMGEALDRYMEFTDLQQEARVRVREFAADVERQVADAHLDARFDFRPVRVEGFNWCQFGTFDLGFEDLGSVVAITGENYAGKSNLSRALIFGLYKVQDAGDRLNHLIRNGQRDGYVRVTFDSNGSRYQIRRTLKLSSDGQSATADVDFLQLRGDTWVPINEGTAAKTQAEIERLIGSFDYFQSTSWAGQNAIDKVLELSPSAMKDRLMGLLHRNFDGRLKVATAQASALESKIRDLQADVQAQTRIRAAGAGAEQRVESHQVVLDVAEHAVKVHEDEEAAAQDRREQLLGKIALSDAAAGKVSGLEADERAARNDRDVLQKAVDGIPDLRAQIAELVEMAAAEPWADTGKAVEALGVASAKAEKAEAAVAEAGREQAVAMDEAAGVVELTRREINVGENARQQVEREIKAAEKAAGLRRSVPCGGETLQRFSDSGAGGETEVVTAGCRFLLDAIAAEAALPGMRQRQADLACRVEEQTQRQTDALNALRTLRESREAAESAARQVLDKARADVRAAQAAVQEASRTQAQAQARARRHGQLEEQLRKLESDEALIPAAKARHEAAVQALLAARIELAQFDGLHEQFNRATAEIRQAKEATAAARAAVNRATADLAAARADLEASARAESEVDRLLQDVRAAELQLTAVEYYRTAMHRDGLPFLLLEAFAIPALQRLANRYLEETDFRVQVTSERELASGEQRNAVNITFTDHRGSHPVSSASGFQRTAIGMAFMAAQADISAEATGSRVWLSVQDEGFGTMDQKNLEGAKRALRKIAERRGHFVFVSHIPGMAEAADSVVTVVDQGGLSVVLVDR